MISEYKNGYCHSCGDVMEWAIVHRLISYNGIVHCYECSGCGQIVPSFGWGEYQETGKFTIPV